MVDLIEVFKDMIDTQDKAQNNRLAGLDFKIERLRAERLETLFNDRMRALPRVDQLVVVERLILDGFLDPIVKEYMEAFDGTWGSIKTDYHRVAMAALDTIQTQVTNKDALDLVSHSIKHMGYSWDDFYKIMSQVRKILKIGQ